MANEGSPNPNAIIVNLLEDARQSDPALLKVTAFLSGAGEGMKAFTGGNVTVAGDATAVVASRTVPANTIFHLKGFDGRGESDGLWRLKVDGQVAAIGSTSAAQRVAEKQFEPEFRVLESKLVALEVTNMEPVNDAFEGVLRGWDESLL